MNRLRLKKNALNNLKNPLRAPHLRAEFPERIVRATRGFTVKKKSSHCRIDNKVKRYLLTIKITKGNSHP